MALGTYRNKYNETQIVDVLSIATNAVDNSAVVVFQLKGFTNWYTMPIKQFNATFEKTDSKKRKIRSIYIESFA